MITIRIKRENRSKQTFLRTKEKYKYFIVDPKVLFH